MNEEWGPLAGLIGDWEGEGGVDHAFKHSKDIVFDTIFREKTSFKPFGPVDNGSQSLYGLDYKSAMWRDDEENPFHTEVGYWLWDAATGEIMKGFVVPRGISVLAGGTTTADAKSFSMHAAIGDPRYAIGENTYLSANASSKTYDVTITVGDGVFTYDQTTMLIMKEFAEPFPHTDKHTLHRVG